MKVTVTFTFKEYVQPNDNLLPFAVQEIDDLRTEDNRETDDEDEEAEVAACKPIHKCGEAMQRLVIYCHLLLIYLTCQSQTAQIFGK
jgi:hypothetical protein